MLYQGQDLDKRGMKQVFEVNKKMKTKISNLIYNSIALTFMIMTFSVTSFNFLWNSYILRDEITSSVIELAVTLLNSSEGRIL